MSTGSPLCPLTVERPVMRQRWERLTFLHWPFEPAVVQRRLPHHLRVQTYDGAAWVGLVPFFMRVTTPAGRSVDRLSNFCETNVRTYVSDHEGQAGVWFFSLDAAQLGAVAVARAAYRLPYFWSSMDLTEHARPRQGTNTVSYRCDRLGLTAATRPSSQVTVRVGDPFRPDDLDDRDHFLTARWIMFSSRGGRRQYARAEHARWPLRRAELLTVDDGLVAAAGLPQPTSAPLVHYSPGVDVRIGPPQTYATTRKPRLPPP